ncbi:MAG: hypothetical protein EXX96DRAFT_597388 [Benjaminiella poitrasii]|nr:MAG: hypothetical protein EXX96DRAFT_597388 [Benjaminiella poitrasii]
MNHFLCNTPLRPIKKPTKNKVDSTSKAFFAHLKSKPSSLTRSLSPKLNLTSKGISSTSILLDKDYNTILSAALDQPKFSIAQSLVEKAIKLLRKGSSPELAWECYRDLTHRSAQKYISREQYKQLIKLFNHSKSSNEQALEYILTLVEDMKQLGYQVGRKEKLLMMRLLGQTGKIEAMESIFEDLNKDQLLVMTTDLATAQKPFNTMLTSYQLHIKKLGANVAAKKSMNVYGEMLDFNLQPAESTTRLLMENIRSADYSDDMVENVWNWVWTKIGMNVGDKTKELNPMIYKEMVMYFASAGRPEYAIEINDIMVKKKIPRTLRMMTALIHKVGRAGNIERSMALFNEMIDVDGLQPNLVTFNALIDVYAHKKPVADVEGAHKMYDMLNASGLKPDSVTFGTLIDMHAKNGDLVNVQKLYKSMVKERDIKPSPHTFSSLIECFTKLHDNESVMELLVLLKKWALFGAPKAREVYNLMFKGLVQEDYIPEAIKLLDYMTKNLIHLEPRTFTPLLSYYAKRGDTVNTHKVASMMSQANIKPNSYTYAALMESYAKAGDIEGTENIFNLSKTKYRPNTYAYNALLYVYTKQNEMEKVLDTYKRMSKAYVPANEFTYGILMNFYSRRKDVKAVEALMNTMQTNNITPKTVCWTILMQSYFESGRSEDGRNILKRMIDAGVEPSLVSWGVLIKGCIDSKELKFAESVLQEAIERAETTYKVEQHMMLRDKDFITNRSYEKTIPDTIEDILNKNRKPIKKGPMLSPHLFTPIIEAYIDNIDFDKAKELASNMLNLSVPVSIPAYTVLMKLFNSESRFDVVERLWNALHRRDEFKDTVIEGVDALLPKIPLPKQSYDYSNLLVLDNTDDENSIDADPLQEQTSSFALSIYLDSLMNQNRYDKIEALWNELTQENYRFDEQNWNRYIYSLVENNELDKACKIAYKELLEEQIGVEKSKQSKNQIIKTIRKRDDIYITNEHPLHTRTCIIFAHAFQITGADYMEDQRLRTAVIKKIENYVQEQQRKDSLTKEK